VKKFLKFSRKVEFKRRNRQEAYLWMEQTMEKFGYCQLSKEDKGTMKKYLKKVTGYREISRIKERLYKKNRFTKRYTMESGCLQKLTNCIVYPTG
jgi:hypothetical protein